MKCGSGRERMGLMDDGEVVHKLAIAYNNLPPDQSQRRWRLLGHRRYSIDIQ